MKQHEARDFIENNKEALKYLSKVIRRYDTVKGVKDEIELRGRQRALEIVEGWLTEVWGYSDEFPIPQYEEDEDLYTRHSAGRN
ncbi:MAG: hypothetical protein ACTSRU_17630 [Candidatus Hodarchaeales archaeon]